MSAARMPAWRRVDEAWQTSEVDRTYRRLGPLLRGYADEQRGAAEVAGTGGGS